MDTIQLDHKSYISIQYCINKHIEIETTNMNSTITSIRDKDTFGSGNKLPYLSPYVLTWILNGVSDHDKPNWCVYLFNHV
jgi:hypothetical protein